LRQYSGWEIKAGAGSGNFNFELEQDFMFLRGGDERIARESSRIQDLAKF